MADAARRAFAACIACCAMLVHDSAAAGEDAPRAPPTRIVSINACSDQLLLMLAARSSIVALSMVVTNPHTSALWREAAGIPQVRGSAEEVIALKPELVLAGHYANRHTIRLLRELGVPVLVMKGAESFATVREHIAELAQAVGAPERGVALIAQFDEELRRISDTPLRSAAYYRHGGSSAGSNTLINDIFGGGRLDNISLRYGIEGYGYLPLERIVVARPDWLITTDYKRDVPTVGARAFKHPALQGLPGGEYVLPGALTACAGPWNATAAHRLAMLPDPGRGPSDERGHGAP